LSLNRFIGRRVPYIIIKAMSQPNRTGIEQHQNL
jgi:hypothetical protein